MEFVDIVSQWGALLGMVALITVFINVGKTFGFIQDGDAPKWSAGLNILGLAGLLALKVFKPEMDVYFIDTQAAQFANVATVVLAYIVQIGGAKVIHSAIKGLPIIGKSFSG